MHDVGTQHRWSLTDHVLICEVVLSIYIFYLQLLSSASSTDTPLNTLSVLKSKQKAAQSPYILISGGAQSLLA